MMRSMFTVVVWLFFLPVVVWAQPEFTSSPVDTGEYGVAYLYSITTDGSVLVDREIVLTSGTIPAGLSLTDNGDGTGDLSGTPSEAGSFPLELTVREVLNPANKDTQSFTLEVAKATATVTLSETTTTYTGSPQSVTVTTDPEGLAVDITYDGLSTAPTNAGTYAVVATVNDSNYSGSASGSFIISKAMATMTLTDTIKTYSGSSQSVTVTTDPAGLSVDITYDGSSTAPTNAGTYAVEATVNEVNYSGSANATLLINKATATVTLTDMTTTYTGSPQHVTVTTDPVGLTVDVTYDGSATAPANAGSYAVVATVNDQNHEGSESGTFQINKATATIDLNDLSATYDGNPHAVTAVTDPPDLTVNLTYDGSSTPPVNAGSYAVDATVSDANYSGTESGTLVISKATAAITLHGLTQTYNGSSRVVTASTTPSGLTVNITYDGSITAPVGAGSYAVEATVVDEGNYTGSESATLLVEKATADVSITDLYQNVDGSPKEVTVTTVPAGLTVDITYNGSSTPPSGQGTYDVAVTVAESNYQGASLEMLTLNGPPVSSGFIDVNVNEDAADFTINLGLVFDDNDDDDNELQFSIEDNGNSTLFASTTISGTMLTLSFAADHNGTAQLTIRATDVGGLFVEDQLAVLVAAVQDNPHFETTPVEGAVQGQNYSYSPGAVDPDEGDMLTYSQVFKPSWLLFTDHGNGFGLLSGTPGMSDIGMHQVTLEVSDDKGNKVTQLFSIEVIESNEAPGFTSTPVTEVTEGDNYIYNITTHDNDAGDSHTIKAPVLPVWLTLTDHGDGTAVLEGTPGNTHVGDNDVVLKVADRFGGEEEQSFTVEVININDSPEFISTPVGAARQNETYVYNIEAEDMDEGDELAISAVSLPTWLTLSDQGDGTGILSGTHPADETNHLEYEVELVVKDIAGDTDVQQFVITVEYENRPPTLDKIDDPEPVKEDGGAVIISLSGITAGQGESQVLTVTAISDNPDLTGAIEVGYNSPETFASISFQPLADQYGETNITVTVQDDGPEVRNSIQRTFKIVVEPVNDRPVFMSTTPVEKLRIEENYQYDIKTEDPDKEDTLILTASDLPSWLTFVDHGDGTATLSGMVPTDVMEQNHTITLTVMDQNDEFSSQIFVLNVNTPPAVTTINVVTEEDSALFLGISDFRLGYTDADNDDIMYIKITELPTLGSLTWKGNAVTVNEDIVVADGETEALKYLPHNNEHGTDSFGWKAYDGMEWSLGLARVNIEVQPVNDRPILSNIEKSAINYHQGDPEIPVSETLIITDFDHVNMSGATVSITKDFVSAEDQLLYDNTLNTNITGNYNQNEGVLILEGVDTRSKYEEAISHVLYKNEMIGETEQLEKRVTITVSDGVDDSNEVSRAIKISEVLPEVGIVNAFTPNGDGVNDVWDFTNLEAYKAIKIVVHSKDGVVLFSCVTSDCHWDGTSNGKKLQAGTYFYTMELNGGKRKYHGTVTILK